ncbi:MAG: hypothetical protein IFNCLDLE_02613 [Ignavibacteriaceae bacterium]|nr:hypothetical protein [Ignavibacteriaceae bacterium]
MPIEVKRANDKYRATLRSTWISDPAGTTLEVTAVPENVPAYITVGWNTQYETLFSVTGKSGDNSSNYTLTGVTRVKGANVNIPENTAVNCLNNEEYFNQYETEINSVVETANDAAATVGTLETVVQTGYISLPAASLSQATTSPCDVITMVEGATNDVDYKHLAFDKATEEYAWTLFDMPDYWDGGAIQVQFKWTTTAATGDVVWGVKGIAFDNDSAIDQAYGTPQVVTDSVLAAADIHESAFTANLTLAGSPAGGNMVQLKIYRKAADAADTLDADARLISVRIKFTVTT